MNYDALPNIAIGIDIAKIDCYTQCGPTWKSTILQKLIFGEKNWPKYIFEYMIKSQKNCF